MLRIKRTSTYSYDQNISRFCRNRNNRRRTLWNLFFISLWSIVAALRIRHGVFNGDLHSLDSILVNDGLQQQQQQQQVLSSNGAGRRETAQSLDTSDNNDDNKTEVSSRRKIPVFMSQQPKMKTPTSNQTEVSEQYNGCDTLCPSEYQHFLIDGVNQSSYLELFQDFENLTRYLLETKNYNRSSTRPINGSIDNNVDFYFVAINTSPTQKFCHWYNQQIEKTFQYMERNGISSPSSSLSWGIYLLEFDDKADWFLRCPRIERQIDSMLLQEESTNTTTIDDSRGNRRNRLHYAKRSVVLNRTYNITKQWVDEGSKMPNIVADIERTDTSETAFVNKMDRSDGVIYHQVAYGVRSDIVTAATQVLLKIQEQQQQEKSPKATDEIFEDLESKNRTYDVAYFWPKSTSPQIRMTTKLAIQQQEETGVQIVKSKLRHQVSYFLQRMVARQQIGNSFIGIAGRAGDTAREGVNIEYIQIMMESKIVVVVQRDSWIDMYRLMEALSVSGSLVMVDSMDIGGLPGGLQDGVSLVEFDSVQDLQTKILYYLQHDEERIQIAKAGRQVAMSRHRSWHMMERLLLGQENIQ